MTARRARGRRQGSGAGLSRTLAAAAAALLLGSSGCERAQTAFTGKRDQGPRLAALKTTIADYRARFLAAVSGNEPIDIPGLLNEGERLLDTLEKQGEVMSFMDGQSVKLHVASGRRIIQAARGFAASNDLDGVRAHRERLDGVLFEIASVLDRAMAMTDNPPPSGP